VTAVVGSATKPEVVVFGYGAVGKATVDLLLGQGRACRVAQRQAPANFAEGAEFRVADMLDSAAVRRAMEGARQVVLAVGFPYDGAIWRQAWPPTMANVLAAAAETGARVVFVDNLYMYGPQTAPLVETMPLTGYGTKPRVRAEITRLWQAAAGRVRFAAMRAPDFYGPGVGNSHLGERAFGALAKGGAAQLIVSPDMPHDMAYVPDFARAVVALLDAPDESYGQAWHLPSAPTRTLRDILAIGARALGVRLRIRAVPSWMIGPLGLFMPIARELGEMRFQWDRPYHVDATRFSERFGFAPTPFEVGAVETARSFV
jgi:nucleoside-diphosphate-sugar epimerase